MAVSYVAERVEDGDTTNQSTPYVLGASFAPDAVGNLLVCILLGTDAGVDFSYAVSDDQAETWSLHDSQEYDTGAAVYRLEVWTCKVSSTTARTVSAAPSEQVTSCIGWIGELTGQDATTPVVEVVIDQITSGDPNVSLTSAPASDSLVIAFTHASDNGGTHWTAETGWTARADAAIGGPASNLQVWTADSPDQTFTATGTNGTFLNGIIEIAAAAGGGTDTEADVSWAEMEVPDAPRSIDVSFAEMEVADAPRSIDVSWSEMELPNAPRSIDVSWAEMEAPDAPRSLDVSFAEMEVADAPRSLDVSWSEMEVATAPRSTDVSWSEMELPDAPRSLDVSWAEMEAADAPRSLDVSWSEMEVADAPRSIDVSFAEMEVPDEPSDSASVSWAEMEVPTAPRSLDVSWSEMEIPTAPRSVDVSWAEMEAPSLGLSADVSWAEMEIPTAPRSAQVSYAELVLQPGNPGHADGYIVSRGDLGVPGSGLNQHKRRARGRGHPSSGLR